MPRIDGPVTFRGGGFAPRNHALAGAATLIGLVLLWQLGASLGMIHSLFLPAPVTIAAAMAPSSPPMIASTRAASALRA